MKTLGLISLVTGTLALACSSGGPANLGVADAAPVGPAGGQGGADGSPPTGVTDGTTGADSGGMTIPGAGNSGGVTQGGGGAGGSAGLGGAGATAGSAVGTVGAGGGTTGTTSVGAGHGGTGGMPGGQAGSGTTTGGKGGASTRSGGTSGTSSSSNGTASSCTTTGWCQLANTKLKTVCPAESPGGSTGCSAVTAAWGGGIAAGPRLVFWGGGHNDYWGNEVYALDLDTKTLSRLNEPSPTSNVSTCPEALTDGTPNSRHTYNGLAYLAHAHRLFSFGGSKSSCGFMSAGTWTLDLETMKWTSMDPHKGGTPGGNPGVIADYDAATHLVYLHDGAAFWQYDFDSNTYTKLKDDIGIDYHLNGVIDPKRKKFVMFGGNEAHVIGIEAGSSYAMTTPGLTGCAALSGGNYPGLAYDAKRDRIVGWAGGDTVHVLDMDTLTCTSVTYSGGPGPQIPTGTNGRWRYFPSLDLFALVNNWDQDAFALRLP